ncbi:MAG: LysR family transcriptional regulator [Gammaproteobacteria bacterium]|nr:LysR family transcriptional regulator [Gammaproteobacteria bacterium]MCP5198534.1 LysR family transcriptional regulator [Gammaproteobacteria bacterium]
MELRNLRYFIEIVERGSMKRAAESLFVAQPALSQQMAKLEDELGVKLLTRSVRGVQPTEAGRELLQRAKVILEQVEETTQVIRRGANVPQGSVVLGMPSSISAVLSVPLIVRMQEALPNVSLRVVEGTSGYVLDWLRAGQLEVCILHGVQRDAGVHAEPLFNEELYLITSSSERRRRSVRFAELARMPLILPGRHHGLRDMLDRIAQEHDVVLAPRVEIDAFTQMKSLARLGVGATILSYAAVAEEVARGELRATPIVSPRVERRMYLAQTRGRPTSNAVRATIELLRTCVQEMHGEFWDVATAGE